MSKQMTGDQRGALRGLVAREAIKVLQRLSDKIGDGRQLAPELEAFAKKHDLAIALVRDEVTELLDYSDGMKELQSDVRLFGGGK